ncbi:hypothetical protein DPX39_020021100 [Trypanosoma brucei equiperdum]|uniref:Uncharacterized protein n=1 Tax=Trypanosoma brucei equiperdum TaxID=630700 RepID=A0A3L6LED0_9TRYP|nr:hypothetical protein DPX39_020021100 [Trypanosoma brucei equiperdum]
MDSMNTSETASSAARTAAVGAMTTDGVSRQLPSETRVEVLQRTLQLLRQEILVPYFEPVERLRVTNNRAAYVHDIVDALHRSAFGRGTEV